MKWSRGSLGAVVLSGARGGFQLRTETLLISSLTHSHTRRVRRSNKFRPRLEPPRARVCVRVFFLLRSVRPPGQLVGAELLPLLFSSRNYSSSRTNGHTHAHTAAQTGRFIGVSARARDSSFIPNRSRTKSTFMCPSPYLVIWRGTRHRSVTSFQRPLHFCLSVIPFIVRCVRAGIRTECVSGSSR